MMTVINIYYNLGELHLFVILPTQELSSLFAFPYGFVFLLHYDYCSYQICVCEREREVRCTSNWSRACGAWPRKQTIKAMRVAVVSQPPSRMSNIILTVSSSLKLPLDKIKSKKSPFVTLDPSLLSLIISSIVEEILALA